MKKRKDDLWGYSLIIAVVFIVFIMVISDNSNSNNNVINVNKLLIRDIFSIKNKGELESNFLSLKVDEDGYDVYRPNGRGYRYGPSIIYYEDGTMDMWMAANGNNIEWDWITYRHYDGNEWSNEEIVLRPTPNSSDHYSVCDPGVIFFDDYYYLGYTSTENSFNGGVENCGYVARSKNPNGPFEKWNGEGWGENPKPIITYDMNDSFWGAGEISFVIVNDKLYCYYSWISSEGNFTKLATADLCENWPSVLNFKGTAIIKKGGQDSCDVIYNNECNRFLAFCIQDRFTDNSSIAIYESENGFDFSQVASVDTAINKYSHNMGISKLPNGHASINDDLIIGYAYADAAYNTWGKWSMKLQKAKLVVGVE